MISKGSGNAVEAGAVRGRNQMDHAIVVIPEIAQKIRQHDGGVGFGVVQQDDPFAGDFEPIDQPLAQRSAPNTTMPRDCSKSSVAGVVSKPGKRKNGVLGVLVATP